MTHDPKKLSKDSSVQAVQKALRWEPRTKAQLAALNSKAEILLFGGAAGSLKTETLIMDAVREADNPSLNAILFRESYPQLSDIIRKCRRLLTGRPYWGKYQGSEHTWTFPRNLKEITPQREGTMNGMQGASRFVLYQNRSTIAAPR